MNALMKLVTASILLLACLLPSAACAVPDDGAPFAGTLPGCAQEPYPDPPGPALRIGVPLPQRDAAELRRLALALAPGQVGLCREQWSALLPDLVPWTPAGAPVHHYGYAVFAGALCAWVLLLGSGAPRHWWRPLTLTGLLALKLGGLLFAVAVLRLVNASGWPQQHVYPHVLSWQRGEGPVHWVEIDDLRGFHAAFADVVPAAGTTPRHHALRQRAAAICLPARGTP